jgi:Cof subfamily protein (haloacid dehalogenase superfamily)
MAMAAWRAGPRREEVEHEGIPEVRKKSEGRNLMSDCSGPVSRRIAAVLADVDGTLVTREKVLTRRAIATVQRLRDEGIAFAITSGRPPRGMRMLAAPLALTVPMAAFNGGVMVHPDLSVIDERPLPDDLVPAVVDAMQGYAMDVWIYRNNDWFVRSPSAPHVDREATTVQFPPTVVSTLHGLLNRVVKVVGVSDDLEAVARCEAAAQGQFGARVSAARSQPYYLDVTHPEANKGAVIERLSQFLSIPLERIATIGDQPNDVLMFRRSGLSIAMGNASADVQGQATYVTASCDDEGFAKGVERFILGRALPAGAAWVKETRPRRVFAVSTQHGVDSGALTIQRQWEGAKTFVGSRNAWRCWRPKARGEGIDTKAGMESAESAGHHHLVDERAYGKEHEHAAKAHAPDGTPGLEGAGRAPHARPGTAPA